MRVESSTLDEVKNSNRRADDAEERRMEEFQAEVTTE